MSECNRKKRIAYIDVLRLLAIMGVIIIHVSTIGQRNEVGIFTYNISTFYNSMARWAVPIFFMISGSMFLNPHKKYSFKQMLKFYIPKMVICLIVYGCIYSVFDIILYGSFSIKSIILIVCNVISNHTGYHLWYLYALIGLYLMVPVFRSIVSNLSRRELLFIISLWMILSLGVNQFNYFMSSLQIPFSLEWYFPMITSWAGYFLLGYYLSNYNIEIKTERVIIFCGLLILIICTILNIIMSVHLGKTFDAFIQQDGLTACISSISVFLLVKRIVGGQKQNEKVTQILVCCAENVFGIYLIHVLINSVLFHIMNIQIDFITPVISIPLLAMMVFFISYIIIWGYKKIKFSINYIGIKFGVMNNESKKKY